MSDDTPAPGLIPWADPVTCPFRPRRQVGNYYHFEERYPPPTRGPRFVFLTARQIDRGELETLEIRADWLAEKFPAEAPATDAHEDSFDRSAVAAWIYEHVRLSETRFRRSDRRRAERAPAPELLTLYGPARPPAVSHITTLTAQRGGAGGRISMIVSLPHRDGAERHSFSFALTPSECRQLGLVLAGGE